MSLLFETAQEVALEMPRLPPPHLAAAALPYRRVRGADVVSRRAAVYHVSDPITARVAPQPARKTRTSRER